MRASASEVPADLPPVCRVLSFPLVMRPRDTTEKAAAIAQELNRSFGPERRLLQALELSDFLRALATAGLRARHPEYTEDDLAAALRTQWYGEVARRR